MSVRSGKFHFYIDVVGSCNLACPSCPVGNSRDISASKGVMGPEALEKILDKAVSECAVSHVGLFNWTEPLLHPRIEEMIRAVHKHGITCAISTNLNISKPERFRRMLLENPLFVRVSLSGFTQDTYGKTHRGGDVEVVKRNMDELLRIKEETKSVTKFAVAYHRYRFNLAEEEMMKAFCEERGIVFQPIWALMFPAEKLFGHVGLEGFPPMSDADRELLSDLALPLDRALQAGANAPHRQCPLLENQITLNWKGEGILCCAVYDEKRFGVGSFLEMPLEEMMERRRKYSICSGCLRKGISNYLTYAIPGLEELVEL